MPGPRAQEGGGGHRGLHPRRQQDPQPRRSPGAHHRRLLRLLRRDEKGDPPERHRGGGRAARDRRGRGGVLPGREGTRGGRVQGPGRVPHRADLQRGQLRPPLPEEQGTEPRLLKGRGPDHVGEAVRLSQERPSHRPIQVFHEQRDPDLRLWEQVQGEQPERGVLRDHREDEDRCGEHH